MSNTKQTKDARPTEKLARERYERELARLQGELVRLQERVVHEGLKICILFEGRDPAGKRGVIKRITDRVSPRVFRVVALPPTEREKSQMYVQRYVQHFPAAGEVVIFDRSWYNRAGVERVMGFCPEEEVFRFLRLAPLFEWAMVDSGIVLLKYWLEVGQEEQTRRIKACIDDPRKVWKLSPMDLESYSRWYEYSRARDDMFAATDTEHAPWHIVDANDKKRARLNIISHLLEQIPYESPPRERVVLPVREKRGGYREPDLLSPAHPGDLLSQPWISAWFGDAAAAATDRGRARLLARSGRGRRGDRVDQRCPACGSRKRESSCPEASARLG